MQSQLLLYPLLAHILWMVFLYAVLSVVRAPDVWGVGASSNGENPWQHFESRISANLSNQFEWPMLFYVICALLLAAEIIISPFYIWAAWVFVAGRVVHTGVQVLTTNVRLRGLVFTLNFVAVLSIWVVYCLENIR